MVLNFIRTLSTTGRIRKRSILVGYDVAAMIVALWAAISARLGELYWPSSPGLVIAAGASILFGIFALFQLRVYHIVLRYFDLRTVSRIFFGAALAAAAWVIIVYFTRASMTIEGISILVPRSVGFIYCGFLFVLLFMGRYLMALLVAGAGQPLSLRTTSGRKNIAIYGANAAGISLADSVANNPHYSLCAFIDDDTALHGQIVAGTRIHPPRSLPGLVSSNQISEIFLAMPRASRAERLNAISRLSELDVQVKTVPAPEEIVSGRFTVSDVRPIEVNDLLRREPVEPLHELVEQAVNGRSILITGAGGSIGSEICRQIIHRRPGRMVLLDHSEFALFSIEQQLLEITRDHDEWPRPEVVAVVGSILDEALVRDLIRAQDVDTIYHAAAYKHVPLLERNEVIGVHNNVIGTLVLAQAAVDAGITRFTMISTDKAVRPQSVMGASKRVAELVIQGLAAQSLDTRFGIVRFGNVLDSSGSVVQRFRSQIGKGGPVTVTHPDVTRFFMSIPEATQLVLQASAMAKDGEVFVLDMGEPIKISELARNMINLSGMSVRDAANPGGDIEIRYVGLRPGEKLYEELFVGDEAADTAHPRIKMALERHVPFDQLERQLALLRAAIANRDTGAVRALLQQLIGPDQGGLMDADDVLDGFGGTARDARAVGEVA